jgi:hypothetical protein
VSSETLLLLKLNIPSEVYLDTPEKPTLRKTPYVTDMKKHCTRLENCVGKKIFGCPQAK